MQNEYKEWLNELENKFNKENASYNDLIQSKLIKIAKENEYEYIMNFNSPDPSRILLIFQNKENSKFIYAYANEKGFVNEEFDHID